MQRKNSLLSGNSVARIIDTNRLIRGFCILAVGGVCITSHRIIPTEEIAQNNIVQFNFQISSEKNRESTKEYKLTPDKFFLTSERNNWTAIGVEINPIHMLEPLKLNSITPVVQEPIHFFQLMERGPLRPATDPGVVTQVDETRIYYLTNRHPGLPGSPLFDNEWRLVGFQRCSERVSERHGRFFYRNEATPINLIIDKLSTAICTEDGTIGCLSEGGNH